MTDQRIYQIGLTMINGVGNILAHHLLDAFGDPERIFEERQSALEKIPGIGSKADSYLFLDRQGLSLSPESLRRRADPSLLQG